MHEPLLSVPVTQFETNYPEILLASEKEPVLLSHTEIGSMVVIGCELYTKLQAELHALREENARLQNAEKELEEIKIVYGLTLLENPDDKDDAAILLDEFMAHLEK